MPRVGTSDRNAELAVEIFSDIMSDRGWGLEKAWLATTMVLMTCEVWESGTWRPLFALPVLMERNNYKENVAGPNRYMRDAALIKGVLASELSIPVSEVCGMIGQYFRHERIIRLQPNNPRGHAFRSIVAECLSLFGDPELEITEEQSPHDMFPGYAFPGRSSHARIDIAATRRMIPVSLISARWTYRHDRVDMIDEARAYMPAARGVNGNCTFYGVTAEFVTARLQKVVKETEPVARNAALTRLVHINPALPTNVLGNNGILGHLMSLEDFVRESWNWH